MRETLSHLKSRGLLRDLKPLSLKTKLGVEEFYDTGRDASKSNISDVPTVSVDSVRARVDKETYERWLNNGSSSGITTTSSTTITTTTDSSTKSDSFKVVTLFSSNDYLGLSANARVRRAFARAALEFGAGYRASQLIAGYTNYHRALEEKLANLERKSSCVLFPTGFAANISVLQTLAESVFIKRHDDSSLNDRVANVDSSTLEVEIFSDALNHASIVDGCRLAKARVSIFKHLDYDDLEARLKKSSAKRKICLLYTSPSPRDP